MGAGQACRSWRRAARDDPSLWRRIDMCGHADLFNEVNLHGMAQAAVHRAKGQCEAFGASTPETTASTSSLGSSKISFL
jgi:hypothetical protein